VGVRTPGRAFYAVQGRTLSVRQPLSPIVQWWREAAASTGSHNPDRSYLAETRARG